MGKYKFFSLLHFEKFALPELGDREYYAFYEAIKHIIIFFLNPDGKGDLGKWYRFFIHKELIDIDPHGEEYLRELLQDSDLVLKYHLRLHSETVGFGSFPVGRYVTLEVLLFEGRTVKLVYIDAVPGDISDHLVAYFRTAAIGNPIQYILLSADDEFWNICIPFGFCRQFLFFFCPVLELLYLMKPDRAVLENAPDNRTRFPGKIPKLNQDIFPSLDVQYLSVDIFQERKVFIESFIEVFL